MLRKLILFAITSGLAAKAYRAYAARHDPGAAGPVTDTGVRRKI